MSALALAPGCPMAIQQRVVDAGLRGALLPRIVSCGVAGLIAAVGIDLGREGDRPSVVRPDNVVDAAGESGQPDRLVLVVGIQDVQLSAAVALRNEGDTPAVGCPSRQRVA